MVATVTRKPTRTPRVYRNGDPHLEIRAPGDGGAEPGPGFCGEVRGVALVYGVRDAYGTVFQPGCLDRTRAAKVSARKVKLYLDHNYGVPTHVGTVTALEDVGDAAVMTAGLFDTPAGREAREYLQAVLASQSETGLSVGFFERLGNWLPNAGLDSDQPTYGFQEIELDEISMTPRPAVPGANVTGVRERESAGELVVEQERLLRRLVTALPSDRLFAILSSELAARGEPLPPATAPAAPAAHASPEVSAPDPTAAPAATVPFLERLAIVRELRGHP